MIETIEFEGKKYPKFQAEHNAAKFAIPFAKQVCKGKGLDIGAGNISWAFPGAMPIDPKINSEFDAMNLPDDKFHYIFSSHCLEHINLPWHVVLDYWLGHLYQGGTLFLYLPHPEQEYWLPWNNEKHHHIIWPKDVEKYFNAGSWKNIFVSERDLNYSFMAMAENI